MSQLITQGLEGQLLTERARIVGLCVTLTGDADAAEDLAQEVMLEAWRSLEHLRDNTLFTPWLSGIARNVCRRWMRKQGQLARVAPPLLQEESLDDFDLEVELERKELVELLDRAMAELPPETRAVLVARYIEESSLSDLARRFGLQTSAVAMRLQRGKLALKRVLKGELGADYGFSRADKFEETNIWCPTCGRRRLQAQFRPDEDFLSFFCPECGDLSRSNFANTAEVGIFRGIKRVKPALNRLNSWIERFYGTYLEGREAPCSHCGRMVPIQIIQSFDEVDRVGFPGPDWCDARAAYQTCKICNLVNWTSLSGLVLALPECAHFWREHPRMHELPKQEIEVDGRAAIVTRFESIPDSVRCEVVSERDTFHALLVNGRRV